MHFLEFLNVPSILFVVVVMPIWITLHYRYKSRLAGGLSDDEQKQLDELLRTVDTLVGRIDTLESILDEKQPNWRRRAE